MKVWVWMRGADVGQLPSKAEGCVHIGLIRTRRSEDHVDVDAELLVDAEVRRTGRRRRWVLRRVRRP